MINLKYRLTEEDAIKYYQMIGTKAKETGIARFFAFVWGPAFLLALLIALKLYRSALWIGIAVFLSVLWVIFRAPTLFQDVTRTTAKRKLQKDNFEFKDIDLKLSDNVLTVNGEIKKPQTFVTYYDLMIVAFDDKTNLVIPEHAFKGNEKTMETLMTYLIRSVDK
ncbi:MAG: hypothetical protein IJG59_01085 [Erysipelotrichaceae bacterium]|nr:hypothetical protein [Erysipelotrichaceae bacterium]